jgi:adenosylcobinamide kinase / adenosylcobinamide-phosphate guanylyltransferase
MSLIRPIKGLNNPDYPSCGMGMNFRVFFWEEILPGGFGGRRQTGDILYARRNTMGRLILILGGARSGKSTHALRLARANGGQVVFIATAEAQDDEMRARVAAHQAERPAGWLTLEIPYNVGEVFSRQAPPAGVVLLDCLTLLVSNLLMLQDDIDQPDAVQAGLRLDAEIQALLVAIHASRAEWIVVSNEVGLGLVPPYPAGRVYRDLLGHANQRLAAQADEVYWMVAGIPVPIHGFRLPNF